MKRLLGGMAASGPGAGEVQDEPGTSRCAREEVFREGGARREDPEPAGGLLLASLGHFEYQNK